jgi:hypothetical protein
MRLLVNCARGSSNSRCRCFDFHGRCKNVKKPLPRYLRFCFPNPNASLDSSTSLLQVHPLAPWLYPSVPYSPCSLPTCSQPPASQNPLNLPNSHRPPTSSIHLSNPPSLLPRGQLVALFPLADSEDWTSGLGARRVCALDLLSSDRVRSRAIGSF